MADCRQCEGKKYLICPKCKGSGLIGEDACHICEAKTYTAGSKTEVICPRCGGSGLD